MSDAVRCVCGHAREAHEHFRPGTDCGVCGVTVCPKYRRARRKGASVDDSPRALQALER